MRQGRAILFGLLIAPLLALPACGDQSSKRKLTLTGSSTIAPLATELARAYEAQHPDVQIDVQAGGSSRGLHDARRGLADVGMVSRRLKDDEQDLYSYTIAFDGITMIVNQANPVPQLNRQQIINIYTGKITNWRAVGGPDQPTVVVNKAEGRSTLELFVQHFELNPAVIEADVIIGSNQQVLKTVAGNPWAIGYVSIGTAEYEARHGQPIKLLPLNGIEASTATVNEGRFPLTRHLNLVTPKPASGLIGEFIQFARSPAVHDKVRRQFFVPVDGS